MGYFFFQLFFDLLFVFWCGFDMMGVVQGLDQVVGVVYVVQLGFGYVEYWFEGFQQVLFDEVGVVDGCYFIQLFQNVG